MLTVLVLDGMLRKSLELCRELGRDNVRVLCAEATHIYPSRFSRYVERAFTYPHPVTNADGFLDWLRRTVHRHAVDVVIPTDDDTVSLLAARKPEAVAALLPPAAAFLRLRDKGEAAKLMRESGVRHPDTVVPGGPDEVPEAIDRLGLPVVIKPRISAGSRGLRIAHSLDEAVRGYREVASQFPKPLLQHYVRPGPRYDIGLLFGEGGRLTTSFVWRELRQYPLHGGPSTLAQGVVRDDLVETVLPLFSAVGWTGPAQVDGQIDGETGEFHVIEINPRYWESLHVARRNGIHFGAAHVALALGHAEPPQPAPSGALGRSFLPFDLLAYLADPERSRWNPSFRESLQVGDDLLDREDWGPAFGFGLFVLRHAFDTSMWRTALRLG